MKGRTGVPAGPWKVLHLLPELEEGGVERHVLRLAREQRCRGLDAGVASAGGRLEAELTASGVPHLRLPLRQKNPLTGALAALHLARICRAQGWNLLHAHSRVPAWIAWWTSSLCGVPWVVTCHAPYSLTAGLGAYRHARGALCVSGTVERALSPRLPVLRRVVWTGVEPSRVPRPFSRRPGPLRWLFVGRLTRIKGPDLLLEALSSLPREGWTLSLAGDGPLRGELEALVRERNLGDRVAFLGYRDDVAALTAEADLMLVPSRDEGMGLAAAEAAVAGCPLVLSDLPAFRELFVPHPGLFVPPGRPGDWAQALRQALEGSENLRTPSLLRDLSVGRWLEETDSFYREIRGGHDHVLVG